MDYTLDKIVERLLESYKAYYDIYLNEENWDSAIVARCEYYEHSEKFVMSKKAELWSENSEEFLYLIKLQRFTLADFELYKNLIYKDGMERAHIGPGHMYTYITPVFVCEEADEDAITALKKCRIYKSFRFSFHGWMDFHTAVIEINKNKISSNASGRCVERVLKRVLFPKEKALKKKIS